MAIEWRGVYPAVTTQFKPDQSLDLEATEAHLEMLIQAGVDGLVMLGTVGETASLDPVEKRDVLNAAVKTARGRLPVLAGVAESATAAACRFAGDAQALGCDGLMVPPGLVYTSDARETLGHYRSVAQATDLPVMCYNNPVSYGVDITPEMFANLADTPNLLAIKESSDDVRRLTDLVNLLGDRYVLFCGVDDLALESALMGADGWVAGLANAFPEETVQLWSLAKAGRWDRARALYRWFAPVLHLDCHVKLVQYIKLAQAMCGLGTETVRAPRMVIEGEERERVAAIIQAAIDARPARAAA
jgi:4-hydroxy-tetrahydrodipicolinate synthase